MVVLEMTIPSTARAVKLSDRCVRLALSKSGAILTNIGRGLGKPLRTPSNNSFRASWVCRSRRPGVLGDETQEGIFLPEADRLLGVLAVSSVDAAFLLRVSPVEAVKEIRPEFVVKGKEHEQRDNPERVIVEEYGGKLLFGSGDSRFSTLSLINFEIQDETSRSIHREYDYEKRHDIDVGNLHLLINKMKELNILVLGETIMDEYIDCQPIGMSAEDPTLVVSPINLPKTRHILFLCFLLYTQYSIFSFFLETNEYPILVIKI